MIRNKQNGNFQSRLYGVWAVAVCMALAWAGPVSAQNMAGDLLAGNLVDPRVGQWAWYDLLDDDGEVQFIIRQAIVDRERIGRETAYWLEFEIIPAVGFRTVYAVLLTGPASDPRNIHRIRMKFGADDVEEVPVDADDLVPETRRPHRESKGVEDVLTGSGFIRAERLEISEPDRTLHVWVNNRVLPTGVVRMETEDGEMVLRSFGVGGRYAESALEREEEEIIPPEPGETDVPDTAPGEEEEG